MRTDIVKGLFTDGSKFGLLERSYKVNAVQLCGQLAIKILGMGFCYVNFS